MKTPRATGISPLRDQLKRMEGKIDTKMNHRKKRDISVRPPERRNQVVVLLGHSEATRREVCPYKLKKKEIRKGGTWQQRQRLGNLFELLSYEAEKDCVP